MTVGRLKHEMAPSELYGWSVFFAERAEASKAAAEEAAASAPPPTGRRGRRYSSGNILAMDPSAAISALVG